MSGGGQLHLARQVRAARDAAARESGSEQRAAGLVQRISMEQLQDYVLWGDRAQAGIAAVNVTPGDTYVWPPVTAGSIQPWPTPVLLDQMVDVKYARPTTWSVNLYSEALQNMQLNDTFGIAWEVRLSVGKATNSLFIEQSFTEPSSGGPTSVFTTLQVAAHMIQIIPGSIFLGFDAAHLAKSQSLAWSAWVAPVVQ